MKLLRHLIFLICSFTLLALPASAGEPPLLVSALKQFLARSPFSSPAQSKLSLAVVDAESGGLLLGVNENKKMIPASLVKLYTSFGALKYLGPEFQFPTQIFVERRPGAKQDVGSLYVRGYGDPSMVEEQLWRLAKQIASAGVGVVEDIVLDESLFVNPRGPLGARPYQAALGSLSLNHNSLEIVVAPGLPGTPAFVSTTAGAGYTIKSAVKTVAGNKANIRFQVDSTADKSARNSAIYRGELGSVVLSGSIGNLAGPAYLYHTVTEPAAFFGSVLKNFLIALGTDVRGGLRFGEVSPDAIELLTFRSKRLGDIVRDLNRYSNNFIAEQLMYVLGQAEDGRFSRKLGLSKLSDRLAEAGLTNKHFNLADGSGLSRANRISSLQFATLLRRVYADITVSPDFISSLSKFGSSGTLKERVLDVNVEQFGGNREHSFIEAGNVWGKTGTLDGVSSVGGYAMTANSRVVIYTIIINNFGPKDRAVAIEDGLIETIVNSRL